MSFLPSPCWSPDAYLVTHSAAVPLKGRCEAAVCLIVSVLLSVSTDETSYEAGIKVQIHSQDEPPFIDQLGFGVAPGFQTFVSCQQQLVANIWSCAPPPNTTSASQTSMCRSASSPHPPFHSLTHTLTPLLCLNSTPPPYPYPHPPRCHGGPGLKTRLLFSPCVHETGMEDLEMETRCLGGLSFTGRTGEDSSTQFNNAWLNPSPFLDFNWSPSK